ncbi:phage tail length tape measure family protein [Nitrobacteraceae bacterium UC4446_H13]
MDSSPLARAKAAMQDMVPAARGAQTATEAMVGAVNGAKAAADGLAGSTGRAGAGLAAQSATVTRLANEYKQLSDVQRRINAATGVTGLSLGGDRGADIAAYGREMDALRAKFNPLFAAGRQYKAALAEINQAQRVGAISQKEYADAIMNTKAAFTAQVNSIRGVTDRDNFFDKSAEGARRTGKAMQGLSFDARNLSFQLVDVAQGLAMGQSPMMIFAQQAGQIGQIAATSEKGIKGLFAEIGSGIAKVLTPMRLLTVGVLGLGIGLIALVKNAIDSSKAMDDLAKSINTTRSLLHGLEQVAGGRGINTDEFAAGMKSFGDQVYLAKRNMGDLVGLLRANGIGPVKNLQDAMQKVADLVARTKDDQQAQKLLVEAGLPANEQWVRYMRDLAKGIDNATASTVQFNDAAEQNMIAKAREFDKAWDSAVTKLVNGFKAAAITIADALTNIKIPDWLKTLLSLGATVGTAVATMGMGPIGSAVSAGVTATKNYMSSGDSFSSRFGAAGPNPANDNSALQKGLDNWAKNWRNGFVPEPQTADNKSQPKTRDELLNENRMAQQRIAILGDLASVDDQVRAKELELSAAWLSSGVSAGKYRDAILNAVRAQAEMSRVQQQASIGVFNLNDANKAAADTLQMWIDKKLLDPDNAQQMAAALNVLSRNTRDMADAAKVAGSNLPGLQQALNDATNVNKMMDQFATSSFNSVTTGLADIFDGTKTAAQGFADLGKTVVRALEEMIIKMYIVAPIFNALKGVLGGGGLLGSILPGVTASANGNVFAANDNGISKYSNQVVSSPTLFAFANGIGLMGEAGAEAIMPLQRGSDGRLGVAANGGGGGGKTEINIVGGGINPNDVEVRQTEDGRGNTRTDIVLDQAVANAMSRAGSNTRKAMANNYGARPVGVRR